MLGTMDQRFHDHYGVASARPVTNLAKPYRATFVRNTRAVGVLWGIFTVCFAIINVLAFAYSSWIGNSADSPEIGQFGLFQYTTVDRYIGAIATEASRGTINDFSTILTPAFKASTVFVGISCIVIFLTIVAFPLFLFLNSRAVYLLCACLQSFSFILMLAGCTVYPAGWDHQLVRQVCGHNADRYRLDSCELRWAYILAIIGVVDIFLLSLLGFMLAALQVKHDHPGNMDAKGDFTNYDYSMPPPRTASFYTGPAASRADSERLSQRSTVVGSQRGASSMKNFQL